MASKQEQKGYGYQLVICLLALYSVVYGVRDISGVAEPWEGVVDWCVYGVFWVDYLVFFFLAKDKLKYVRTHIIEAIALVPFDSLFRAARFARIARLLGVAARLFRFFEVARGILDTNGFKYVLFACCGLLLVGAAVYHHCEQDCGFVDSMWWAVVTMSTVGYGDISPASEAGRIVAVVLMVAGVGFLGALSSTLTTFFLSPERKSAHDEVGRVIHDLLEREDELSDAEFEEMLVLLRQRRNLRKDSTLNQDDKP